MVKTRTVVQTRTHAQKYFQKKLKSGQQQFVTIQRDLVQLIVKLNDVVMQAIILVGSIIRV